MSHHATRHNHRDANEKSLLKLARQLGIHWIEAGPLDGWIPHGPGFVPVEIKNPDGRNRLQPSQKDFIALCVTNNWPYEIWRTDEDVIKCAQNRCKWP